ncbi:hypothetical protein OsJ_31986 [Oryza sativa Japonica Group]|uniref:Uncharacterized protein n=1 Tax=Oryza sativa subsp. japonica TaxID=39947 RepID=B9G6D6_ORYSJ|nr:hypothetical protein OsJ_31986 [Oryza sativa Japonica Group]
MAAVAATAGAVTFDATNTASNTAGGQRSTGRVGVDYAKQMLADASSFIWDTFEQPGDGGDRKPVDAVTLTVEDIDGVAFTSGDGIHLSARYVGGYSAAGNVRAKPGQGDRWDQGYDVTARFLDYCDSPAVVQGFVAQLNGKMKDGYSDDFFVQISGKTIDQLWQDYKAKYGG